MLDRPERERGVTLDLLDLSSILDMARQKIVAAKEALGEENADTLKVDVGFAPYAAAEDRNGTLIVVCNEGVGWEVTDDKPFPLDLYVSHPGTMAMMPSFIVNLTPFDVRALMTGEEVDLADHVRSFGERLESNFRIWHRRLR